MFMKLRRSLARIHFLLILLALGLFTRSAQAQVNQTWMASPATTNWNTYDANWDAGAAWANDNNAIFGSSTVTNIGINWYVWFNDITFNSSYTVSSTPGYPYLILGTDNSSQITVANGATATINAAIVDYIEGTPCSLVVAGPGTLMLSNNTNFFTGNLDIQGGATLVALGSGTAPAVTNITDIAGGFSSLGQIADTRTGTITIHPGATLSLGANSVLGSGAGYITKPEIVIQGTLLADAANANNPLTDVTLNGGQIKVGQGKSGWMALNFCGTVTVAGTTPSYINTTTNITAFTGATLGAGDLSASMGVTFIVNDVTASPAADLIVSAILARANRAATVNTNTTPALTKTGAGTMLLATNNTYEGQTLIQAGTLALDVNGSISNSAVFISAGATFDASAKSGLTMSSSTLNPNGLYLGCGSSTGVGSVNLGAGKTLTLGTGVKISALANAGSVGQVSVIGDLTLNANLVSVNVTNNALTAGTNTLLSCSGTLTGSANVTPIITGLGLTPGLQAKIVTTTGSGGKVALVVTAIPASVSAFKITAASSSPIAGTADQLTISAVDASGNTVTEFYGSRIVTFSGINPSPSGAQPTVTDQSGTAVVVGTPMTLNFINGVASIASGAATLVPKNAGTPSLAVTDGIYSTAGAGGLPASLTVLPAADSAYRIVAATSTPAAGVNDALTITLVDYLQNTTLFNGNKTMTFSGLSASANGAQPTVNGFNLGTGTTITFASGTASAILVAKKNEGPVTLAASSDSGALTTAGPNGTGATLTVSVGAVTQVRVESSATGSAVVATQDLGTGNSITVYANSRDAFGNFVANVSADSWSVANITGGVLNTDLSSASGPSTIFTGGAYGTGNIHAAVAGLTSVDSGTITVKCITAGADPIADHLVESGAPVSFTVISHSAAPTYQWQVNKGSGFVPVNGATGVDVGDDGVGGLTSIFTTTATTVGMNTYQYRCVISVGCDSSVINSPSAVLYVADGSNAAFRSTASGNWGQTSIWEVSTDGGVHWLPSTFIPTDANSANITVRSPNTVTIATNVTADSVIVNAGGTLLLNGGILTIADGSAAYDLDVAGTFQIQTNNLTLNGALRVSGSYIWNAPAIAAFPLAAQTTWADGSLARIQNTTNSTATTVGGVTMTKNVGGHNFYNFEVVEPPTGLTGNPRLYLELTSGGTTTVRNDLTVIFTNGFAKVYIRPVGNAGSTTVVVGRNVTFIGNQTNANNKVQPAGGGIVNYQIGGNLISTGAYDSFGTPSFEFTGTGAHLLSPSTFDSALVGYGFRYTVDAGSVVTIGSRGMKPTIASYSGTFTNYGTLNFSTNQIGGGILVLNPGSKVVGNGKGQLTTGLTSVAYAGTLDISQTTFAGGDSFVLFGASAYGGAFSSIIPNAPIPSGTNTWMTDGLIVNGVLQVSGSASVAPTPDNIVTTSLGGGKFVMTWTQPAWTLQTQTNSLAVGLSTNWVAVPGATSPYTNAVNPLTPATFFRLKY